MTLFSGTINMISGEGGNEKYICLKCFQESSFNGILAVRPKYKGLRAGVGGGGREEISCYVWRMAI